MKNPTLLYNEGVLILKTLIIKCISRKYKINKDKVFVALNPTSLSFESSGLISIVGKSGSGKSTLINLIGGIDKPTDGEIYLNNKPYSSFKKKDWNRFYNEEIGIVFQQYNLCDELTVLTNVCLPLLIKGYDKKEAEKIAIETLNKVGIKDTHYNSVASTLSGGEQQRVCIARAIVNKPKIILCDEPTGALDSKNSIAVMELLKNISKSTLVLLVSHNLHLVNKYSDRIIEISDGKIVRDEVISTGENIESRHNNKKKRKSNWVDLIAFSNYKRRIKRNLLSALAFTITLTMAYLVSGFIINKDNSIKDACYRQFDFGSGSLSEEVSTGGKGALTLKKSYRPDYNKISGDKKINEKFNICLNFSAILPQNIGISYDSEPIDDLLYTPIYSFNNRYIDESLIYKGSVPKSDNLKEVIINESAYKTIRKKIDKDPLNETLSISHKSTFNYVDENDNYISDSLIYEKEVKVVGVVREINYLPNPKIYYSFLGLESFMKENLLVNLSTYNNRDISWYDRVKEAEPYSPISSYSYLLFLKDIKYREDAYDKSIFSGDLAFTSQSLILSDSLFNFLQVAEYGLILFLIITLMGSFLILSIMSFTSFSEDHKNSAILTSIGASDEQIQNIYLQESLFNGLISFVSSTILSIGLSKIINLIISKFVDLKDLIKVPLLEFMNVKLFFPLLMILIIFGIVLFSTVIPIYFSKKKSIKGELQSL